MKWLVQPTDIWALTTLPSGFGARGGTEMWTSHMTFGSQLINLSLSSHVCKVETITASTPWGCRDDCDKSLSGVYMSSQSPSPSSLRISSPCCKEFPVLQRWQTKTVSKQYNKCWHVLCLLFIAIAMLGNKHQNLSDIRVQWFIAHTSEGHHGLTRWLCLLTRVGSRSGVGPLWVGLCWPQLCVSLFHILCIYFLWPVTDPGLFLWSWQQLKESRWNMKDALRSRLRIGATFLPWDFGQSKSHGSAQTQVGGDSKGTWQKTWIQRRATS